MPQRSADDPQDDAATVVSMSRHDTMVDAPASPHAPKAAQKIVDTPPPEGLEDQTNFLPTKQVIMVFMGLSIALACSMLDQTMCVALLYTDTVRRVRTNVFTTS